MKGEAVKDPMDAFAQNGATEFLHIAYTTNDSNLKNKWLGEVEGKEGDLTLRLAVSFEPGKGGPVLSKPILECFEERNL